MSYDGTSIQHYGEKEGIKENRVRSILIQDDFIWLASVDGLYRFDGTSFVNYSESDGLSSNNIYALVEDVKGDMWAGYSNGIGKISFKDNKIQAVNNYGLEEGLFNVVSSLNCIEIVDNNVIYFGTEGGLLVYQMDYDVPNENESKTRVTDVKLFSQETNWLNYVDSVSNENIPFNPVLDYDKNYLEFNFIAVSHTNSAKIRYQFMLKGLDKDWLPVTDQTKKVYSNLKHGSYEFLLKASNGDGVWNKEPVSFKFKITPPFWLTWWFFTFCLLVVLSGVYSYLKIRAANRQILEKNTIIEEKSRDILDSLNYAQKIQQAILPSKDRLSESFKDHFVLYKPKDIVSGDFYWMKDLNDKVLIAAVDCTGHGVPGAFVSIVGHTALNRAVNEFHLRKPSDVLDKLNFLVVETLNQDKENEVKDGMDMSLCLLDRKSKQLSYAGANNPIYIVSKHDFLMIDGQKENPKDQHNEFYLFEIKADKQPIGLYDHKKEFSCHQVDLNDDDAVYLFSDGYPDQFGGPKGKKFRYNQFRQLLFEVQPLTMEKQEFKLNEAIENWKGDLEQVDDICVIGLSV